MAPLTPASTSSLPAPPRLAVFTSDLSYGVRRQIVELSQRLPGARWLILVHAPRRSLGQLVASQRMNVRKHGWRWIPYQMGEALRLLKDRLASAPAAAPRGPRPGQEFELDRVLALPGLEVVRVSDIHGPESLARLREFGADLGLSLAAPILKPALFELPRLGSINLHKGRLPQYRGMPPAFWELWTDQDSVGCSVHWVNAKLDQGDLLATASVARERYSDVRGLQIQLDEVGIRLVNETVQRVLAGDLSSQPQPTEGGKTYRKPTLQQERELARRLQALGPARQPWLKRVLKDGYARLAFAAHHALLWRWQTPRVTVLLFHRVTDSARDNLTVGIAQFERYMQLVKRHCDVLSMEELLALGDRVPRSRRPLVALSFDDGYLDNHTHAAAILRRVGLPCAFYVSTGIVNSDRQFPHDDWRGNGVLPVMSWDQLRELRDWGFSLGSHTVSHINCATEPEARVREELAQSQRDLNRELGTQDWVFAYPFGGRQHMTAERLEWVKQAGFSACLSAYGGSNLARVDRWNVQRYGVHWEYSDAGLLLRCLGWE